MLLVVRDCGAAAVLVVSDEVSVGVDTITMSVVSENDFDFVVEVVGGRLVEVGVDIDIDEEEGGTASVEVVEEVRGFEGFAVEEDLVMTSGSVVEVVLTSEEVKRDEDFVPGDTEEKDEVPFTATNDFPPPMEVDVDVVAVSTISVKVEVVDEAVVSTSDVVDDELNALTSDVELKLDDVDVVSVSLTTTRGLNMSRLPVGAEREKCDPIVEGLNQF